MGAVVEIWFESLIPFLLKDSHIVQCPPSMSPVNWSPFPVKRSPNEQDQFKRHTGVELCVSLTDFGNGPKYSMLVFQMRYK